MVRRRAFSHSAGSMVLTTGSSLYSRVTSTHMSMPVCSIADGSRLSKRSTSSSLMTVAWSRTDSTWAWAPAASSRERARGIFSSTDLEPDFGNVNQQYL
jgi:hypothetical protein